jgi:hypothetical protein
MRCSLEFPGSFGYGARPGALRWSCRPDRLVAPPEPPHLECLRPFGEQSTRRWKNCRPTRSGGSDKGMQEGATAAWSQKWSYYSNDGRYFRVQRPVRSGQPFITCAKAVEHSRRSSIDHVKDPAPRRQCKRAIEALRMRVFPYGMR